MNWLSWNLWRLHNKVQGKLCYRFPQMLQNVTVQLIWKVSLDQPVLQYNKTPIMQLDKIRQDIQHNIVECSRVEIVFLFRQYTGCSPPIAVTSTPRQTQNNTRQRILKTFTFPDIENSFISIFSALVPWALFWSANGLLMKFR